MPSPPEPRSSSVLKMRFVDGAVFVAAEGCSSVDVLRAGKPTRTFVEKNGHLHEVSGDGRSAQPRDALALPWRDATAARYRRIF